ncbi:RidA family protein [Duganella sp. P38]|jgi:enamine deaminase RidA (YjgF/YER057c/UK114 family)|uniref:RidA family protein n=1 Tax=Duganella sp. P38 TaxID=3423949 RepID=UPI003D7A81A2
MKKIVAALLMSSAFGAVAAPKGEIVRHKIPNSDFPIALAVTVPASATLHFISGQVPAVVNPQAPGDTPEAFGDTKTQSETVLKKIQDILRGMQLEMADVVKMQVFLVGDPAKGNKADTKGFMEAYTQYFGAGAGQPQLPARAVVQVAALSNPGWLVEIEVVAAKK